VRSSATASVSGGRKAASDSGSHATVEVNGSHHAIGADGLVVGRGAEADLRINDPGISRRHAEFRLDGRQVKVADLGSTNGTLVDGRRVSEAPLRDGSVVRVGSTDVTVRVAHEEG
jgi:pSer/pThr/pTyr-binding forkhead associated (FHA) protein